ncbi:MAG TPA: DUF1345 domain-containing protein [Flavisolibacter sp.]
MNTTADNNDFLIKLHKNYRLYLSLFVALIVYFFTKSFPLPVAFMLVWTAFSGSFLIISWIVIFSAHPKGLGNIASEQDTSRTLIFLFVLFAAFISVFAIIGLLQQAPHPSTKGLTYHILLAAAAVFSSWTLIHTVFTLRYAHMYYTYADRDAHTRGENDGGLEFPGTTLPDFLDFAYFSFVLGMTFQVSDVQITSPAIRRLALLHGFLSFVYNTIIIALSINIISGVIGK